MQKACFKQPFQNSWTVSLASPPLCQQHIPTYPTYPGVTYSIASITEGLQVCKKLRKTSPRCRARTPHRVGCRAPQQANIILLTQPPYAGHAGRTSLFLKTIRLHSSKLEITFFTIQLEKKSGHRNGMLRFSDGLGWFLQWNLGGIFSMILIRGS